MREGLNLCRNFAGFARKVKKAQKLKRFVDFTDLNADSGLAHWFVPASYRGEFIEFQDKYYRSKQVYCKHDCTHER